MTVLADIAFPVFYLGRQEPLQSEGLVFYSVKTVDDEGETDKVYIIDDKNLPGKSLSSRRLKLRDMGVTVARLRKAIFFIADLLKLTKSKTWFIDTTGKVFSYSKTKRVPLVFKPISKIIAMPAGGAIVEVDSMRYKMLFLPNLQSKWAGILKIGASTILYGVYQEKLKDTYRMI
jgi:hypothetical protein